MVLLSYPGYRVSTTMLSWPGRCIISSTPSPRPHFPGQPAQTAGTPSTVWTDAAMAH